MFSNKKYNTAHVLDINNYVISDCVVYSVKLLYKIGEEGTIKYP